MMKKLLALLLLPLSAFAGTATLTWTPPTACADGQPITVCQVTGYNIFRATSASGPWTSVGTVAPTVTTYLVNNLATGTHYFQLTASAGSATSAPSNTASKVVPPPAPNPPVLTVVEVVAGVNTAPVFGITATGTRGSTVLGFASVGAQVQGPTVYSYRGKGYCRVPATSVKWWNSAATTNAAAACG